jgi:hypothetical protein
MKFGFLHQEFFNWNELPRQITRRSKRSIRGVRAIWYIPILGSVAVSKIAKRFPQYRKAASILYFYSPNLLSEQNDLHKKKHEIPSSSELLIIDTIRSKSDYAELVNSALSIVEKHQATLIRPPPKNQNVGKLRRVLMVS